MNNRSLRGLYVIADAQTLGDTGLADKVAAAIKGGAAIVQYRDKRPHQDQMEANARQLLDLCQEHRVTFIVNDAVELAARIGAHGVHLGKDDLGVKQARALLGARTLIGVSCYDEFPRAELAEKLGADYIAFGRFYPSATKPLAVQAEIELLHRARSHIHVPVCAIGGITVDNGGALIQAGADMLAVVQGVFGESDITLAAQKFQHLFQHQGHIGLV